MLNVLKAIFAFSTILSLVLHAQGQSTQPQDEDFIKMKEDELWANIVKRVQNPMWISKLGVLVSVGVIVNFTMLSLIGMHFTYVLEANRSHRSRILELYTDPYGRLR